MGYFIGDALVIGVGFVSLFNQLISQFTPK